MTFPGIAHIAVTVSDLERSTQWYRALFGSEPVLDEDVEAGGFHHTVFALGGGQLFGLHAHTDRLDDHVGFGCGSRRDLEAWVERLDLLGVKHGGIIDAHYGSGLSFRDPDGIALELFAPPA